MAGNKKMATNGCVLVSPRLLSTMKGLRHGGAHVDAHTIIAVTVPNSNSLLTDFSQLEELNSEVWSDIMRARKITLRVKPKFWDISSPSQNTANEPESKATETLPHLDQTAQ